jgi:Tol biopolymer transport system component
MNWRRMVVPCLCLLWTGCSDGTPLGTAPPGDLRVSMVTVGEDVDPDGYALVIDRGAEHRIGVNETVTLRALRDGQHLVEVTDVADNCEVAGGDDRTVTVPGGTTATTEFRVTCYLAVPMLRVITETVGSALDPDGYQVRIGSDVAHSIGISDALDVQSLTPGAHVVSLLDIAPSCQADQNPRTVTVARGSTTTVRFRITCTAPGADLPGQIAFSSDRAGGFDIYLLRGGVVTPLTRDPAWDGVPAISPDGTRVLFESTRADGRGDIFVINVDGSGLANLTQAYSQAVDERPNWSPDGSRILFVSDRSGSPDIHVMNADGSNPVNLTNHPGTDRPAMWSPDGSRIAFSSNRTGDYEIFVMDADGGNVVNLSQDTARVDFAPAWSPDGGQIAYTSRLTGEPNTDIRIMAADGTGQVNLITTPLVDERGPSWSPDGTQIVFGRTEQDTTEIYVMNRDGSDPRNVWRSPGSRDVPGWPQAWRRLP